MIPAEIKRTDILNAIKFVDLNGCLPNRKSTQWDLLYKHKRFPPKYIISKAAEFSSYGKYHIYFGAVEARNFLLKHGFEINPKEQFSDVEVIDDLVPKLKIQTKKNLKIALKKLNTLPPEIIEKIIIQTNRNDTALIKILKGLYDHKCQMLGCNAEILMENGSKYCEVAHITPFAEVKCSVEENLIVLCPNHHKELDLGRKKITFRDEKSVRGKLNGKYFEFNLQSP